MKREYRILSTLAIVIVVIAASFVALSYNSGKDQTFTVYSADAYVPEVKALLSGFHNSTGMSVSPVKGGGSFTDASQISGGSPASVFVSVSLESYSRQYLGNYSSGWALAFASDQMVIAYSNATLKDSYAKSIIEQFKSGTPTNDSSILSGAFSNLSSGKVKVGISNAKSDPAGVRAWLTMEMAGFLYHNGNSSYYVNRMESNGGNYSGSNAAELVAPLTQGQIQFLFIYRSSAISHNLSYIALTPAVNQGNASDSGFYSTFSYNTGISVIKGSPILLLISIINNGTAKKESLAFLTYLVNNTGILSNSGLTLLKPMLLFGSAGNVAPVNWGLSAGIIRNTGEGI